MRHVARAVALAALPALLALAPTLAARAAKRPGGTITVAIGRPGAIDPANAYEPNAVLVARTLCDTLLTIDPVTGDVRAGLADAWLVSNSGSRIMVRLRRGAKFSDGSAITAQDVAASISRAASAEFAGSAAELLRPIAGFDEIRGERRARTPRNRRELAGVVAVTDRAVEISLSRPGAAFLRVLTHPVTAPVPRRLASAAAVDFSRRPVCAGAYRLRQAWTPGDATIALLRVAKYRGPRPAYADRIEFRIGADSGAADIARVPAGDAAATATAPSPQVEYLGLPAAANSPFANPNLRRALSLAIDRTAIAHDVYRGGRDPATGFIPPAAGRGGAPRGVRRHGPGHRGPNLCSGGARGVRHQPECYAGATQLQRRTRQPRSGRGGGRAMAGEPRPRGRTPADDV